MEQSADALDAAVCLLAARDFLMGEAMAPENESLARLEGWIWARRPVCHSARAGGTCERGTRSEIFRKGRAPR